MDMMISNSRRFSIGNNNSNMERRQDQDTNDNHNPTASSCTSENGSESPPPSIAIFHDFSKTKNNNINNNIATNSSASKKSSSGRRSAQKRVVTIPIKEIEGSRSLKGESCHTSTPPSDSWAWRKYGQKPIKGSPYPRGYYRCSSSKGCPARKQVERSSVDPTMLLVTYSAEHNHPWPAASSRNHHHQSPAATSSRPPQKPAVKEEEEEEEEAEEEEEDREMISSGGGPGEPVEAHERLAGLVGDDFGWFGDHMDHHTAALESPVVFAAAEGSGGACESLAAVFPMGEEDESLFADLGELPECSLVFRHRRAVGPQVEIF